MIKSVSIKNYRILEDFELPKIGAVNLLTGKNNTGKTAFLEALLLYFNGGDLRVLKLVQQERGVVFWPPKKEFEDYTEKNQKVFDSIFSYSKLEEQYFSIKAKAKNEKREVELKFVIESELKENTQQYEKKLKIFTNEHHWLFQLKESTIFHNYLGPNSFRKNASLVKSSGSSFFKSPYLWDSIILTEKERVVIDALKIVDNRIEKLAFIEEPSLSNRVPVVKLKGRKATVSLRSMGDGINRTLAIILNMVNAENGYLLIDEFENGLHHSVQKQLWEVIFSLSKQLNIQVFATTHSEDCIRSFEIVSNADKDVEGKLFRLENKKGKIRSVGFDEGELKIATEFDIEVR